MSNYSKLKIQTERFLALYVAFGFLFIMITSTSNMVDLYNLMEPNKPILVGYAIFPIIAGISTYYFRKKINQLTPSLIQESNIFPKIDMVILVYGFFLGALGLLALSIIGTKNSIFMLFLLSMIGVINVSTYFNKLWRPFTRSSDLKYDLEILKLEHREWGYIFGSLTITCIVVGAGSVFSYFSNRSYFNTSLLECLVITYTMVATPIIWLFRPIHCTMVRIRKDISELQAKT